MAQAEYTHNFDLNTGAIHRPTQDGCVPRFFVTKEPNPKTGELKEIEYVEIIIRGDKLTKRCPIVTEAHRQRWPREYAAFKNNMTLPVDGTRLSEWSELTERQVQEMALLGFRTVEDFAGAQENQIANIPNGHGWRKRAQMFIAARSAPKDDARDAKIANLEAQVQRLLEAKNEQVSVSPGPGHVVGKRRGGRPRKNGGQVGRETPAAGVGDVPPVPTADAA